VGEYFGALLDERVACFHRLALSDIDRRDGFAGVSDHVEAVAFDRAEGLVSATQTERRAESGGLWS
jgi:hypothetical protein